MASTCTIGGWNVLGADEDEVTQPEVLGESGQQARYQTFAIRRSGFRRLAKRAIRCDGLTSYAKAAPGVYVMNTCTLPITGWQKLEGPPAVGFKSKAAVSLDGVFRWTPFGDRYGTTCKGTINPLHPDT